jgi:hypothetical protein
LLAVGSMVVKWSKRFLDGCRSGDDRRVQAATLAQFEALFVFAAIASVTVAVPPIGVLIAGRRADEVLAPAKDWLVANTTTMVAVLLADPSPSS